MTPTARPRARPVLDRRCHTQARPATDDAPAVDAQAPRGRTTVLMENEMTDHLTQAAQAALARLIREVEARGMEMAAGVAKALDNGSNEPGFIEANAAYMRANAAILAVAAKHWKAQHD